MKTVFVLAGLLITTFFSVTAQDFVIKNDDSVIRGTVKGTDYFSVYIRENDEKDVILLAKDVKSFFWNGNSYLSKGFAGRNDLSYRFVKVLELGTVNLYTFGGERLMPVAKQSKTKFRPTIGIGTGTGGGSMGGVGLGGGISFGGGGSAEPEQPAGAPAIKYFLEKPGTGPMQEIPMKAITDDAQKAQVKTILLQKLGDQATVKTKIESGSDFNSRDVINLVQEYNAIKK
ncbi:hypothetical protein [Pedobacter sp. MW01-1-1]|uniref:hypothetical protein n=1 Tax=Pedobacter sp. MW01-1-1 TaxID=3383027 RepID=UPI003FF0B6E1